jgi:hypothetical protein
MEIHRFDGVLCLDSWDKRLPRCDRRVDQVESGTTASGLCTLSRTNDVDNNLGKQVLQEESQDCKRECLGMDFFSFRKGDSRSGVLKCRPGLNVQLESSQLA